MALLVSFKRSILVLTTEWDKFIKSIDFNVTRDHVPYGKTSSPSPLTSGRARAASSSRWKILAISQILILQRLSRVYRMRDDYRLRCTIFAVLDDKRVIIAGSSSYRTIIVMSFSYRTIIVMSFSYRTIIVMSSSYRTIIVMSSSYRTIIVISSSYCTMIVMSYCYRTMILISDCDLTIIDNISNDHHNQ